MKCLVTGAAGFIGSHLVDRLLGDHHDVIGVDNFSTGNRRFLEKASESSRFHLYEKDLFDPNALHGLITSEIDWVFHLAANADVRDGLQHPERDLQQNTLVTWYVLEAMRKAGARRIAFSSTGSVYGDAKIIPTPETCPFPVQTSLYGASKLAGEALISAYAKGFGFETCIYRFVSFLGERYSHGHVYDFVAQLKAHPDRLDVLGDGKQKKSYLHVADGISAIMASISSSARAKRLEIYNLGTDAYVDVNTSISFITDELGVRPQLTYSGGDRGWVGDNPFILLDCSKIRKLGWAPEHSIEESVRLTAQFLLGNPWVFTERGSHA